MILDRQFPESLLDYFVLFSYRNVFISYMFIVPKTIFSIYDNPFRVYNDDKPRPDYTEGQKVFDFRCFI